MKTKIQVPLSEYRKLSDEELVYRWAHRADEQAGLQLFERFGHLTLGILAGCMSEDRHALQANEAFWIPFFQELSQYRGESIRQALFSRLQQLRSKQQKQSSTPADIEVLDLDFSMTGAQQWEERQRMSLLATAINRLPALIFQTLSAFYEKKQTHRQIATSLSVSVSEVRRRIQEGRLLLKNALDNPASAAVGHLMPSPGFLQLMQQSHCLTRRQLQDYAGNLLAEEEVFAIEHHLNTCSFCTQAVEGMTAALQRSLESLRQMNSDFIKEYFHEHAPKVHLNTLTPTPGASKVRKQASDGSNGRLPWRTVGLAAALLIGAGVMWFLDARIRNRTVTATIPENQLQAASPVEGVMHADAHESASDTSLTIVPASASAQTKPVREKASLIQRAAIGGNDEAAADDASTLNSADARLKQRSGTSGGDEDASDDTRGPGSVGSAKAVISVSSTASTKTDDTDAIGKKRTQDGQRKDRTASKADEMRVSYASKIDEARAYAEMGQKEKALQLLQNTDEFTGRDRRIARRLRRQLERED